MYNINKNIQIHQLNLNGSADIPYFYHNDRLFFIYNLEEKEKIDEYFNFQTNISEPDIQDLILRQLNLTIRDKESYSHINAFLWDLYIIITFIPKSPEDAIPEEKISEIERNKFVARKIILQKKTKKEIEEQLNRILSDREQFVDCIEEVKPVFDNNREKILNNIIADPNDNVEKGIKEELNISSNMSLSNIIEYIESLQSKYLVRPEKVAK